MYVAYLDPVLQSETKIADAKIADFGDFLLEYIYMYYVHVSEDQNSGLLRKFFRKKGRYFGL